ncbi:unnamed protein product, partial [Brassica rapa]
MKGNRRLPCNHFTSGFCINLKKPGLYYGNHEQEQWWF